MVRRAVFGPEENLDHEANSNPRQVIRVHRKVFDVSLRMAFGPTCTLSLEFVV